MNDITPTLPPGIRLDHAINQLHQRFGYMAILEAIVGPLAWNARIGAPVNFERWAGAVENLHCALSLLKRIEEQERGAS